MTAQVTAEVTGEVTTEAAGEVTPHVTPYVAALVRLSGPLVDWPAGNCCGISASGTRSSCAEATWPHLSTMDGPKARL